MMGCSALGCLLSISCKYLLWWHRICLCAVMCPWSQANVQSAGASSHEEDEDAEDDDDELEEEDDDEDEEDIFNLLVVLLVVVGLLNCFRLLARARACVCEFMNVYVCMNV